MRFISRVTVAQAVRCLLIVVVLVAFLAASVAADILSGMDLLRTEPGTTEFDFGAPPGPPLPADFFGPGSDPFDGVVAFEGNPLGSSVHCPNDILFDVSTIVDRVSNAALPTFPSSDVVPIEIIELSLVSSQPITVTYFGGQNPELWDVNVELSLSAQPQGQMFITRTHENGGTFDIDLPVLPRFVFTRQSDSQVVELDFGGMLLPPVELGGGGIPWEYKPLVPSSCTTDWCPSPWGPFVLTATNATHGVRPLCPGFKSFPVLSSWMTVALLVLLIAAGSLWMRRRTRTV
jgi:hypothetical protein